jgi:hypothetical protein
MDDVIADPEHPDKECIVNFETKSLRDTRELLASTPIAEAYQFVEDNPHPRLWRIIAEAALEQLNFLTADKCFVRCSDYQGIQVILLIPTLLPRSTLTYVASMFVHYSLSSDYNYYQTVIVKRWVTHRFLSSLFLLAYDEFYRPK